MILPDYKVAEQVQPAKTCRFSLFTNKPGIRHTQVGKNGAKLPRPILPTPHLPVTFRSENPEENVQTNVLTNPKIWVLNIHHI